MVRPAVNDAVELLRAGAAHHQAGRFDDALSAYTAAIQRRPGLAQAHYLLGSVWVAKGFGEHAEPALSIAIKLNPQFAEAWSDRSAAHLLLRRPDRALADAAAAVALQPAAATHHYRLGLARLALGQQEASASAFHRVARINVEAVEAWTNYGAACQALDRHRDAAGAYRRALALAPALALALDNLGAIEQLVSGIALALPHHRRSIAAGNVSPDAHSNIIMGMTYLPEVTAAALYAELRGWEARYARPRYGEMRPHANRRDPDRPLKIGYLSADLFGHPIGINIAGLISGHDRTRFATYCYAGVEKEDALTSYLRTQVDHWFDMRGLKDDTVADQIRKDEIDILVVMAGHTGRNRLAVAAYKPAPIQISYGDLSTTGLEVMDYWLTDRYLSPEGIDERFTETLLYLPMMVLHQPPDMAPEVAPLPAQANARITFGSCNNPAKLNDRVLALWAGILGEVEQSRLLLKFRMLFELPEVQERVLASLARHGIARERVSFAGGLLPRREHLALVSGIDIALDPFPFNGCTTTFEALWMGVPVITLAGNRFLSRMGTSFLKHASLDELVAVDPDDYRAKAVALARDLPRLAALRTGMRARIARSPLCASEPYARSVEAAYRQVWRRWCAS
jgi:predicted O-linked N-acetylglucosamine transferase (SPINDLY family)